MKILTNIKEPNSISERLAAATAKAIMLPQLDTDQFIRLSEKENIYYFKFIDGRFGVCYNFDEDNQELNLLARTINPNPLTTLYWNDELYMVVVKSK